MRPEYASLQAILFGPFVLAGLSTGDWDAKDGNSSTISDWITTVPSVHNSQLYPGLMEILTQFPSSLVTGVDYSAGTKIQVSCKSSLQSIGGILEQAASFVQTSPQRQYHPISFVAKKVRRNFVLEPLYSFRDEFYTVYFSIGA
uniref:Uncharacterized protein n=1 Tax=Setaria italica TaxID=4555 RepID=K3YWH7_SETIT